MLLPGPRLGWGDGGAVNPHGFSLWEPTARGLKLQTPTVPASGRPAQSRGTEGDATAQPQDQAMFWDFPAGLVARRLLPVQGARVRPLVQEEPTYRRATKPMLPKKGPGTGEPTCSN